MIVQTSMEKAGYWTSIYAPYLGLGDWTFVLDEIAPDSIGLGIEAEVTISPSQMTATISLDSRSLVNQSPMGLQYLVVHELMHVVLSPYTSVVEDMIQTHGDFVSQMTLTTLNSSMESVCERLARAMVNAYHRHDSVMIEVRNKVRDLADSGVLDHVEAEIFGGSAEGIINPWLQ